MLLNVDQFVAKICTYFYKFGEKTTGAFLRSANTKTPKKPTIIMAKFN
jgi:hypothetical protein